MKKLAKMLAFLFCTEKWRHFRKIVVGKLNKISYCQIFSVKWYTC